MVHPSVPNSPESADRIRLVSSLWSGAMIRLSWAHERLNQLDGSVVFEEEILETRVKSIIMRGRRDCGGEVEFNVRLEVDASLRFADGYIELPSIDAVDAPCGSAVVYFCSTQGLPAQSSRTVKIERVE